MPVILSSWTVRLSVSTSVRACALALLAFTPALRAQSDPRLLDAVRQAQDGQGDSARAAVTKLLTTLQPADSLYPEALYTMGLVSRNVDDMRRNYSRVAVEFTTSAWADDALVRLGMLDYAAGNPQGTVRQMEKVRSDYPGSPVMATAAEWAARALFDQRKAAEACKWVAEGYARVGDDVEAKNRLDFLNGRCSGVSDTTPPTPEPGAGGAAARTGFGVQVGAVATKSQADKILADLKAAGFPGYVVKDGNLLKVRVGPYADRAQALAAIPKVKAVAGGTPFVVHEP
jgi:hypothetical protein